jgi:hypothetical protein
MNNKELSYINPDGYVVFTSDFLKNKGTCCRSACIHCPFGFTVKKHGFQFRDFTHGDESQLETMLKESNDKLDWKTFDDQNIKFIFLKNQLCGVLFKNHIVIKHFILAPQFQKQGISKELLEAYLF